jgi:hypothetical protein
MPCAHCCAPEPDASGPNRFALPAAVGEGADVETMLLWSFQRLSRIGDLEGEGELTGSWEHVPPSTSGVIAAGYRGMVAAMHRAGVPTHGRPPVWAWGGGRGITLEDARSLVGDPLRDAYATVEFDAPAELVVASDYGAWNDHLYEAFQAAAAGRTPTSWSAAPVPIGDHELVQVCLPILRLEWVREIRALPCSATAPTDWSAPA